MRALAAASASAPDLENVVPLLRPGGRPFFPSYRRSGLNRGRRIPAWAQLLLAAAVLARLMCNGEQRRRYRVNRFA